MLLRWLKSISRSRSSTAIKSDRVRDFSYLIFADFPKVISSTKHDAHDVLKSADYTKKWRQPTCYSQHGVNSPPTSCMPIYAAPFDRIMTWDNVLRRVRRFASRGVKLRNTMRGWRLTCLTSVSLVGDFHPVFCRLNFSTETCRSNIHVVHDQIDAAEYRVRCDVAWDKCPQPAHTDAEALSFYRVMLHRAWLSDSIFSVCPSACP